MFLYTGVIYFATFCVMVLMNRSHLVKSYICLTIYYRRIQVFYFHAWKICHPTKEEHFFLAPNFHFFLHRCNAATK